MQLKNVEIRKLHGIKDYRILFENNTLILVAENGSGKTTIVNMIYFFLSRQWVKLMEFRFESIIVTIDENELEFKKSEFNKAFFDSVARKRIPTRYLKALRKLVVAFSLDQTKNNQRLLHQIADEYDISPSNLSEVYKFYLDNEYIVRKSDKFKELDDALQRIFNGIQILYLPTYRRIERDLKNIFPNLDTKMKEYENTRRESSLKRNKNEYIELVEFGMDDVKEKVETVCYNLKNNFYNKLNRVTGSYLEDILNRRYEIFESESIIDFDDEALDYLMKRLDDKLISESGKYELRKFVERIKQDLKLNSEDKIKAYFVWKLLQVYEEQKTEEVFVNSFVAICNEYISDGKRLTYDKDNFKVEIQLDHLTTRYNSEEYMEWTQKSFFEVELTDHGEKIKEANTIDFKELSSGEKQIISLFSHLLFTQKEYFIIIDEPELSLSVPWQYKFLPDIMKSAGCRGLLAVTHSPFIFHNNLKDYSHSLEEFYI